MRSLHLHFATAAVFACFVCVSGCNQQATQTPPAADTRAADEAAVRAASAEWAKVAAAKDLEKTLSYYAEDASMLPPNMPIVTGAEARRKMENNGFSGVTAMKRDAKGNWTATATKSGKKTTVSVSPAGKVSPGK